MAVGLGNAYGIQSGFEALHDIISRRKKDELLAAKMEADRQEQEMQLAQFEEQKRQFGITNQRLEEAAGIVQQRQREQDAAARGKRVEDSSVIGENLTPDKVVALQQSGAGNAVQAQPILPGVGIIEKIGAKPTIQPGTETGGGFQYGGTAQQVHQAEADQRAEEARAEASAREDRNAENQQVTQRLAIAASDRATAAANRPQPVGYIDSAGQFHSIGDLEHGTKVVADPNKLLASDAQMKNAAKQILPHIQEVRNMADQLNARGLIGPVGSRWGDFVAGKIGSGELAAGDPEGARLLGKFRSELKLLQSGSARAHAGARGAGSEALLAAMAQVTAGGADMPTFMGALDGLQSFMEGYAQLGEAPPEAPKPRSEAATPGAGLRGGPGSGAAPKKGDVKTFPNGRTAIYDGSGWVAQ